MIYKNFELYNVGELIPAEGGGYHMSRMSAAARDAMSESGKDTALCPAGVEIRFVLNSGTAKIKLRSNNQRKLMVCYGAMHRGANPDIDYYGKDETVVEIGPFADQKKLHKLTELCGYEYSADVIRVILEPFGQDVLVDLEGDVRPPRPDEVPQKRFMMYGSSITHGSFAMTHNNSYVYQLARHLGYDGYNLGFGGSCLLEKEVCDYLAEQGSAVNDRTWDFAIFELGVNTLSRMDHEEFASRAKYLFDVMAEKNPDKKLFVTDIYFHLDELSDNGFTETRRMMLRRELEGRKNIVFIPGRELLTGARGLSPDGIHPNIDGVREIADNWYKLIKANI